MDDNNACEIDPPDSRFWFFPPKVRREMSLFVVTINFAFRLWWTEINVINWWCADVCELAIVRSWRASSLSTAAVMLACVCRPVNSGLRKPPSTMAPQSRNATCVVTCEPRGNGSGGSECAGKVSSSSSKVKPKYQLFSVIWFRLRIPNWIIYDCGEKICVLLIFIYIILKSNLKTNQIEKFWTHVKSHTTRRTHWILNCLLLNYHLKPRC